MRIISNEMLRTDDLITMPALITRTFDCILKGHLPLNLNFSVGIFLISEMVSIALLRTSNDETARTDIISL